MTDKQPVIYFNKETEENVANLNQFISSMNIAQESINDSTKGHPTFHQRVGNAIIELSMAVEVLVTVLPNGGAREQLGVLYNSVSDYMRELEMATHGLNIAYHRPIVDQQERVLGLRKYLLDLREKLE